LKYALTKIPLFDSKTIDHFCPYFRSPRASGIIASDACSSAHRPHDLAVLADPSRIPGQLSGLLIRSRFWNFLLLELHSPNRNVDRR
jgi:hypothetical protein